jgi:hypothetical protein
LGGQFCPSTPLSAGTATSIGVEDADVLVSLNPNHAPTADYVKIMREQLPRQFPGTSFAFLSRR